MIKQFAVLGDPIAHSKSPEIHQAFAEQFNLELSYERIQVKLGELDLKLKELQEKNYIGVNITLPLKQEAWELVTECTERATAAKAVNTIFFKGKNNWLGDNTDGIGLVRDLTVNYKYSLENKKILILGAGGAVRGILKPLLEQKPVCLVVVNRTLAKAEALVKDFSQFGNITASDFSSLGKEKFDLIINATAASVKGESLALSPTVVKNAICYDLAYGSSAQAFLTWAKQQGASVVWDGLGMLVEQAAEAFYIWNEKKPKTQTVINQLRR